MKYGVIVQNYGEKALQMSGYNLGDGIQTFAVRKLYKDMKIPDELIQEISLDKLSTYDGDEYIIIPMLSMALGIGFAEFPLPDKIIPVFISTHIAITELTPSQIEYLKAYAPIGCRDEYSLKTMRRYGIPAYISGCITMIFDKIPDTVNKKDKKIFFIDTPKELEAYIPEEMKKDIIYSSHLLPIPKHPMTLDEAEKLYYLAVEQLKEYKEKASLVVSSRLHALVPCMAMGIPVIGVFENISYRFSWLDKLLKLYTVKDFKNINWNPEPLECEELKCRLKQLFSSQLSATYEKYHKYYVISEFWENRSRAMYGNHYAELLLKINKTKEEPFSYIIWGCGLIGNTVYETMNKLYPNANLKFAVDEYKSGTWHNTPVYHSEALKEENDLIILATYSGKHFCYETMRRLGKIEGKDFIYVATVNG